jgi:hypothetical protein
VLRRSIPELIQMISQHLHRRTEENPESLSVLKISHYLVKNSENVRKNLNNFILSITDVHKAVGTNKKKSNSRKCGVLSKLIDIC